MNATAPLLLAVLLACLPAGLAAGEVPPIDGVDPYEAVMGARDLDEADAAALRARLEEEPGDHVARAELMAYERWRTYADGGDPDAAARAHALGEWFVREHPGARPTANVEPSTHLDPAGYARLAALWEPHLAEEKPPLPVLQNAAGFFLHADGRRSRALLERAVALYPQDAGAHRDLAFSWALEARHPRGGDAVAAAAALENYLAAERLAAADDRTDLDGDIAEMAWMAGNAETAERYARGMVADAGGGWNGGNRVYHGNRLLGHLALDAGDTAAAVAFLDAAGASEGSPQLDSFGPDFSLAQALLDAGEDEAVLRHLDAVGRFWDMSGGRLEAWSGAIRAGVPVELNRQARP